MFFLKFIEIEKLYNILIVHESTIITYHSTWPTMQEEYLDLTGTPINVYKGVFLKILVSMIV